MADYRVIQHINTIMCDRIQGICDGLELNWVGIHKDLDTEPKDDEEATIWCTLYRIDDVDDLNLPGIASRQLVSGPRPEDEETHDLLQKLPRFFYLYFIVLVDSPDSDLSNVLLGAILNGFHQQRTLSYRPVPYELDGRVLDSTARPMDETMDGFERKPEALPLGPGAEKVAMERVSVSLSDDLAFGDACLLLKGFDRKIRPYLTYRVFAKIDQPLRLVQRVGGVKLSLFDQDE